MKAGQTSSVLSSHSSKLLLIRNDNIGDLICSIPAIQLIRKKWPNAEIDLLVNSYNAPIVECLVPQWVNRLVVYQKMKHVGLSLKQLIGLVKFYARLYSGNYDAAVLLVGGVSRQAQAFARWSGAKKIFGYGEIEKGPELKPGLHELEYSWNLVNDLMGISEKTPASIDYPIRATGDRLAIQITSRKLGNRWDVEKFVELAKKIFAQTKVKSLLLWSPGNAATVTHPGDDDKAGEVLDKAGEFLDPRPTATLYELVSTLKECQCMITPDGGAMHLAAAMGVWVVALFGQSEPERWRPWTPKARVLRSSSRDVNDIPVEEVMRVWKDLTSL